MGTLKDQPRRDYARVHKQGVSDTIKMLKELSKSHKITLDQAIKIYEIETLNRNIDVIVDDYDRKDEQLMGLAEYLDKITEDGISVRLQEIND